VPYFRKDALQAGQAREKAQKSAPADIENNDAGMLVPNDLQHSQLVAQCTKIAKNIAQR
jgi:hypothetical protein